MSNARLLIKSFAAALALAAGVSILPQAHAQANIVIQNADGPGEGFNDPTPVAPIGGNAGTTLGQQRLNVFLRAAQIWGQTLTSTVTITVRANFDPLSCSATSAVLGAAGAISLFRFPASAPPPIRPNTWYNESMTNRFVGFNASPNPEIGARFNSNLGQPGCLTGSPFYLGLDNAPPAGAVNLFPVVLHEIAHGLGFQTFTAGSTGAQLLGFPSIYDHFLRDNSSGKLWTQMTDAERAASAINFRRVVWDGPNVTSAAPSVLSAGSPTLTIASTPVPSASGGYPVGLAAFGPTVAQAPVTGQVMPVSTPATGAACLPLTGIDALAVRNNIALIDRGGCGFAVKVKNAQNAGARGVIIVNDRAGPPPGLGGVDPTITIPTLSITQNDGLILKNALRFRSRTSSGVIAAFGFNPSQLIGADTAGRVLMYTPNPFEQGSSVSHFDTLATRNLLMEPSATPDLTQSVRPPQDLTFPLFQDLGW